MALDQDSYLQKVYAGILGKLIGVYLGRPVEGWPYEEIRSRFGEIKTYVNEQLKVPLVVADDDLSGTFTFVRALEDSGFPKQLKPAHVGQAWLNYLIEERTILWWGGRGNSTEHTAYLNLRRGIEAPESGSRAMNGATVANQIGAMIFIDSWSMLFPGDPGKAAEYARIAASVSHDEEALNAAAFIAAMEARAFEQGSIQDLLEAGLKEVPSSSAIAAIARDVTDLRSRIKNWREARDWLDENHGYARYPGSCHVLPNFGLILLALLYGEGDFRTSISIAVSSGWDTDCNAANLGCLLGIRGGLDALELCPDLRYPHRDLMFISSADGGHSITDAAREAVSIARMRAGLRGEAFAEPKSGVRFPFAFPGSLHGFQLQDGDEDPEASLSNVQVSPERRGLELRFGKKGHGHALMTTPVFVPSGYDEYRHSYELEASPTLYPGQNLSCLLSAPKENAGDIDARFFVEAYYDGSKIRRHYAPWSYIAPGHSERLSWTVDVGGDYPLVALGIEFATVSKTESRVLVDWIDWKGLSEIEWRRRGRGHEWTRAWVRGVDHWAAQFPESFRLSQDRGIGLILQGTRDWRDYSASASISFYAAKSAGIVLRAQGMRRYYALAISPDGWVRLLLAKDGMRILGECRTAIGEARPYLLELRAKGSHLSASVDGKEIFAVENDALSCGAAGFLIEEGTLLSDMLRIVPLAGD